jgi:hypothetical protein
VAVIKVLKYGCAFAIPPFLDSSLLKISTVERNCIRSHGEILDGKGCESSLRRAVLIVLQNHAYFQNGWPNSMNLPDVLQQRVMPIEICCQASKSKPV